MKNIFLALIMLFSLAAHSTEAAENTFTPFVGAYKVIGGDCLRDTAKIACPSDGVSISQYDDKTYVKEFAGGSGESFELIVVNHPDFSNWDVAEFGGTPPDFGFWRRQQSEPSGHVLTVMRQLNRKSDHIEYNVTFYEKKSLNGPRVTLNYKYLLQPK